MGKDRTSSDQTVVPSSATRRSKVRRSKARWSLWRIWHDSSAVTSVEYAVMLALILGLILISIKLLGANTKALWTTNNTSLQGAGLGGS